MQKKTIYTILTALAVVVISLIIAWGASSYFGERKMGQRLLLPPETEILSFASFHWPMNSPAEIEYEKAHLGTPEFKKGYLTFSSQHDTYFYLYLKEQKLVSELHRFVSIDTVTEEKGVALTLTFFPDLNNMKKYYVSHYIDLPAGRNGLEIDLDTLEFYENGNSNKPGKWGKELKWAEAFRLDFENFESGEISIKEVNVRSGSIHQIDLSDRFNQESTDGTTITSNGKAIKLAKKTRQGSYISYPIGVGSITRFLDLKLEEANPLITLEIASGQGDSQGINWNSWHKVPESGMITDLEVGNFIRIKANLKKEPKKKNPTLSKVILRTIDLTPPGMSSPLFGTANLPTLTPGRSVEKLLSKGSNSIWIRLPFNNRDFNRNLNNMIAANVNVVGSINLDIYKEQRILEFISKYSSRILVWEFYSTKKKSSSFFTGLFVKIKQLNPVALILPEKINSNYFQSLALKGTYAFSEAQGAKEEILNRGFWWYFVVSIVALLIIIALGPIIGYHFRFGIEESKYFLGCLLAMTAILIPVIFLTGLGTINLPSSFEQIQIAFTRFVFSSLLQEFILAMLLLLQVFYLSKTSLGKKKSWIVAVSFTSILFGLTHLGYPSFSAQEVIGMITVTTLMGLMTGYVFYKCRSLTMTWIIHLIANIFLSTMTSIASRM